MSEIITEQQRDFERLIQEGATLEELQKSSSNYLTLMTYYRCALMEIETKFNVLNEEFSLQFDRNPINSIKGRIKKPMSIFQKLQRKNLPINVKTIEENLYDVAGIRVVCPFLDDVYLLSDALLNQDDVTLIKKKDYIQNPKDNGYRSLHLIVAVPIFLADQKRTMHVEIQLRTIAMDFWASLEHQLRYKKDREFSDFAVMELYECGRISANLDERMNKLLRMSEE